MSLLPICSNVFERLIYNEMFGFFLDKSLIISGFKPRDSYINQLLSITHNIQKPFDDSYEVRGVFLTFQKHLIKSGTMFYIQITIKWNVGKLHGLMLWLEFLNVPFLDHWYF